MSTSRTATLLATLPRKEWNELSKMVPDGMTLEVVPTGAELDRALEGDAEWAGLIASDGFHVGACEAATAFRRRAPFAPVVVMLDDTSRESIGRALSLRALVAVRPADMDALRGVLEWVLFQTEGERSDMGATFDAVGSEAGLTPRELAVFAATMMGATKREISGLSGVALTTVKSQRQAASSKIGLPQMREVRRSILATILQRRDAGK